MNNPSICITEAELASAFFTWEQEYRAHPEHFHSEATKLQKVQPQSYASSCAHYIFAMLERGKLAREAKRIADNLPAPAADTSADSAIAPQAATP